MELNISCRQLTEGLQRIQSLNNECDEILGAEKTIKQEKIGYLKRLNELTKEVLANTFTEIEVTNTHSNDPLREKVFVVDYLFLKKFLDENNLFYADITYIEVKNNRINTIYLNSDRIVTADGKAKEIGPIRAVDKLSGAKELADLAFYKLYIQNPQDLIKIKKINRLSLSRCEIDDYTFLSQMKSLVKLAIHTDQAFSLEFVKDLPFLERLDIGGCENVENFEFLLEVPHLKSINFYDSNLRQTKSTDYCNKVRRIFKELEAKGVWVYHDLD